MQLPLLVSVNGSWFFHVFVLTLFLFYFLSFPVPFPFAFPFPFRFLFFSAYHSLKLHPKMQPPSHSLERGPILVGLTAHATSLARSFFPFFFLTFLPFTFLPFAQPCPAPSQVRRHSLSREIFRAGALFPMTRKRALKRNRLD